MMKKNKPEFKRTDFNKKRFKNKWRKPRGIHNKLRLGFKGHQAKPGVGYGTPSKMKHKDASGLYSKLISTLSDLKTVEKGKEGVILSSTLGLKSKLEILKEVKKLGIKVINVKDIDKFLNEKEKEFEEKRRKKKKKEEAKKKKEEKAKEKKPKEKEKKTEEEIKKEVMKSDVKEPAHKQKVAQRPKEQKVDSVRQQIVPGGRS